MPINRYQTKAPFNGHGKPRYANGTGGRQEPERGAWLTGLRVDVFRYQSVKAGLPAIFGSMPPCYDNTTWTPADTRKVSPAL